MAAAGMGILYSTSFLQAGFLGLGALWLASYLGHGGYGGHGALKRTAGFGYGDPYGGHGGYGGYGGYGDYGGGGGYGPHHGGYGAPTPYHRSDSHMADSKLPPWPPSPFKRKKRYVGAELEDVYWHEGGIKEEELMVSTAHDLDSDKCGLRLVCELAAVRNRNLSPDEQDILDFVSYGDDIYENWHPGEAVSSNSIVLTDYKKAMNLGRYFGFRCARRYDTCRYTAEEMIGMMRRIKSRQLSS